MPVGIWTIQDDDFFVACCAGIYKTAHCDVVGIEAQSYILNIHQEDIEALHSFVGGPVSLSVSVE